MNRRQIVIIGGGFAGLRAAVELAEKGFLVTVLESRNSLGGRARSFIDPATGELVDNGQHLFIGAYRKTLKFLEKLGTQDKLVFQKRLRVDFVESGGKRMTFECPPLPSPWHLVAGLAGLPCFTLREKWMLRWILYEVKFSFGKTKAETAEQWLVRLGQGAQARRNFWNPLIIAALNEEPDRVDAAGLKQILRELLFSRASASRLGIAAVGLSDLYAEQAKSLIEKHGGQVLLNRPVLGLKVSDHQVEAVRLANGTELPAEAVICTVPPQVLLKILSDQALLGTEMGRSLSIFKSSPIVSVNLWVDQKLTDELFVALIGTRFQWLFNKEAILAGAGKKASYVSLIMSAARDYIDLPNDDLVRIAREDLAACFPAMNQARTVSAQVVREREATVSLSPGMEALRPGHKTILKNFFLAGDWTATGLPATIESAVISGAAAARACVAFKKSI